VKTNAALSVKLIDAVHKQLPDFDTHEALCRKVYNDYGKNNKQSFNQLTAYTFKLTYNLAQNYPNYLHHNIQHIEKLVNETKTEEANFIADVLLDISQRVEDFQSSIFVLKFFIQQAFLTKDTTTGFKLSEKLEKVFAAEQDFNRIVTRLRTALYLPAKDTTSKALQELMKFYTSYFTHEYACIRIVSRYAYLSTNYYFNPGMFESEFDITLIRELEREFNNCSYVVFPFLFDVKGVFGFLILNSSLNDNSTANKKRLQDLNEHYESVKFWKSYLNMPKVFSIAVQATKFLSANHFYIHRHDYKKVIGEKDLGIIKELAAQCNELLELNIWDKNYKNDLVSVRMLYGALLILSGGENIKKGIAELESLLITFQQVNLSGTTDSIFLSLMIGYFSLKNYDKCTETFRRYEKIIKGKPVYHANDISIHTYYYLSRWFLTESNQYLVKLKSNYERTNEVGGPKKAIEEFVRYFNLPIKL
jgi:hypothetical protein